MILRYREFSRVDLFALALTTAQLSRAVVRASDLPM